MKIALVYPPTCDPTAPYLAVPMLTGYLRRAGVTVVPIDANIECYDHALRADRLIAVRDRIEARVAELERKPALGHEDKLVYARLWNALADAHAVPDSIARAVATLRDPQTFYEAELYAQAVDTVQAAVNALSSAYAPTYVDFTAYRSPFALTSPEEIRADAEPERNPFSVYVSEVLIPRLMRERPDAIGLSVCFPGQMQPAYAFALQLRQAMPDVHLTVGGPAITQLLIRQQGPTLAAALGPFDTAVVYEGETTLLELCRAIDEGRANRATFSGIANLVHRDPLLGAKYRPGEGSMDMRTLPAPDFAGLPLDLYLSPARVLPYDPTRGCYWGKCTFCHYGLAEVGTASYRERSVETCVEHLSALAAAHAPDAFYLSQDSVAPKTLVKLAQALAAAKLNVRWATDLKAEKYLTPERARILREGGAIACALGVESGNQRVLELIDKGAPVQVVGQVMEHLADAGIAAEAMCFTGFPTETLPEAIDTLTFLDAHKEAVAAFIVGRFDLTHGALVAQAPERFGLQEVWQVEGDRFGTTLFYKEVHPSKTADESAELDDKLDALSQSWLLRPYPWAGSLSTAHTILYYLRFGPDVFRSLAGRIAGGVIGATAHVREAAFDLDAVLAAASDEAAIWKRLIHEKRAVGRALYAAEAALVPPLPHSPQSYRLVAGRPPRLLRTPRRGRRPEAAANTLGSTGRG